MKKLVIVSILLFLYCANLYAQYRNRTWVFGDSAGVDFMNLAVPIPLTNYPNQTFDGNSCISDEQGNLLFYTYTNTNYPSVSIRNSTGGIIENGDSIWNQGGATQGVLFLPQPNHESNIYLFSIAYVNGQPWWGYLDGLYYSVIDANVNGGDGEVVQKNVWLLNSKTSFKLTAVRHANGRDWWIMMLDTTNAGYYRYLLSPDGIEGPWIQNIGSFDTLYYHANQRWGQLVFSPSGDKLVNATYDGKIDLFDFDRCTGLLNNFISLGEHYDSLYYTSYYGCSFSPNGNVLYVSGIDSLFQFDLTASDIKATKQFIWCSMCGNYGPFDPDIRIGHHKLGPDGKVYISFGRQGWPTSVIDSTNLNLSVINNPDIVGLGCNFDAYSFYLGGRTCSFGLPNMPNYDLGALEGSACDTITSLETIINASFDFQLTPNPANAICFIRFKNFFPNDYSVIVYNQLGQVVFSKPNTNQINIQNWSGGLYYVEVKANGIDLKKKLVVE